jgi:hypothetical protein
MTKAQAKKSCDMKLDQKVDDMKKADDEWKKKCTAMRLTCFDRDENAYQNRFGLAQSDIVETDSLRALENSKKIEDQTALAKVRELQRTYETDYAEMEQFRKEYDKCRRDTEKQMKDSQAGNDKGSGDSNNKTPRMVVPEWKNGVANGQMVSNVKADESRGSLLNIGPKGVRIGALKDRRATAMTAPFAHDFAYAQAEFFYDCAGAWDSDDCNGKPRPDIKETKDNEEAMWHLRWRARLRRYNVELKAFAPFSGFIAASQYAALADLTQAEASHSFSARSLLNLDLRRELMQYEPKEVELH